MSKTMIKSYDYGKGSLWKLLINLAPPVMLAQLIQAVYNIVDSIYLGKFSTTCLTALSIIYPLQLLMMAIAIGTGVGINTLMARYAGLGKTDKAEITAGIATPLAVVLWAAFALTCYFIMPWYVRLSTSNSIIIEEAVSYGRIVTVFSLGMFIESCWTKVIQAEGDMRTPMIAQVVGAVFNIVMDPLLIFGFGFIPAMGVSGAAIATVTAQTIAAVIVFKKGFRQVPQAKVFPSYIKEIYKCGFPNILQQAAYTFYILGLNLILSTFGDAAVTTLGLYYKWQVFFLIPLLALHACIVPVISFNYAAKDYKRCEKTFEICLIMSAVTMFIGMLCFEIMPELCVKVFTDDSDVVEISGYAFRLIGLSFLPAVTSLTFPVFFQATLQGRKSSFLTILRTVILFVPLGYLFHFFGLKAFWLTFPCTEIITTTVGFLFYRSFVKRFK